MANRAMYSNKFSQVATVLVARGRTLLTSYSRPILSMSTADKSGYAQVFPLQLWIQTLSNRLRL